jgi:aconitate hydratase
MLCIESTPAMADRIYRAMSEALALVRPRLGRPLTLADKILLGHLEAPREQELVRGASYLALRPDRVVLQDVLGQTAFLQFAQTGRERVAVATSVHCDHLIEARHGAAIDLRRSLDDSGEIYDFLESAAARYGAGFWRPGAGIIHQVVLENYSFPGQLIVGTDSHTPNAGGLGACAIGVGGADAVEAMAGVAWELLYPQAIAIYLTGELGGWAAPKDVIAWVAGELTVSGATNAIVEYIGPGARSLSATGKATIANMGAEIGATTSLFPADEAMERYLVAVGRGDLVTVIERHRDLLAPDAEVEADPELHYERVLRLDLSRLEPHVVGPHSPDRARPLSRAVELARRGDDATLAGALIGSCTNSSYQDMSRAADVAAQAHAKGARARVPFYVTPGSESVRATIVRDGQLGALEAIGATVLASACGPCIGQWRRDDGAADRSNRIVTSFNRNFPGRNDDNPATMSFIASPEIVTAFALAGTLAFDPLTDVLRAADGSAFRLRPPAPAPDVPAQGFEHRRELYLAPPHAGHDVPLALRPGSQRLAVLEPWPAWDGHDLVALPLLMKTRGKTTTDAISPAGRWLAYRGHLERFSDNFLSGAIDAFSGERGITTNVLTHERRPVAEVARSYRSRGLAWVIVGDANYGEGSSREHAALSPRLLGGVAVIARSFARIHESNLKKQGLLALTFADPASYDLIASDDRISLLDLAQLAAGKPVSCQLAHADGTTTTLSLLHSYSDKQLAWFRAGSALAALRARA